MARPKAPLGQTQTRILDLIRAERIGSVGVIAKRLTLSRQVVSAHIKSLVNAGKITRVDGTKLYRAT